jgi:uncharacterized membrane protein YwaF
MSNVIKAVGIVIIVIVFVFFFIPTTMAYDDAVKKLGMNVLTSDVGKQIIEYWVGEWIIIGIGIGILALGVKMGRRSSSN